MHIVPDSLEMGEDRLCLGILSEETDKGRKKHKPVMFSKPSCKFMAQPHVYLPTVQHPGWTVDIDRAHVKETLIGNRSALQ